MTMNANALVHREWKDDEWRLGADGQYGVNNFGQKNEVQSSDALHGFVDYKHLFSDRMFCDGRLDGFYDGIAGVHYRIIIGPALGYYFIKTPENRLSGLVGPSFIDENVGSPSRTAKENAYMTLRINERFEHNFNKTARIWEQVDYYPKVDDFNTYLLNSEVGAEAALNTKFSLRIVLADKFNSRPPPGRKQNDILLITAIVYKY